MHTSKKINIAYCFENNCGGETIATHYFLRYLTTQKETSGNMHSYLPLQRTSFYDFFSWVYSSIHFFSRKLFYEKSPFITYTTTYTAACAALPAVFLRKTKVVFHYHGSRLPDPPLIQLGVRWFSQSVKYLAAYILQNISFIYSELIIVPSFETVEILKKKYFCIAQKKYAVIPNGYDVTNFFPISKNKKKQIRRKIGIADGTKVLLYSGRLEPKKNVNLLLIFFKHYLVKKGLSLVLAYNKPQTITELLYVQKIFEYINKNKLSQSIILIENAYTTFIPAHLYGAADCVISFSDTEVSSLVEIEASACHVQFFNPFIENKMRRVTGNTWESVSLEIEKVLRTTMKSFDNFNKRRE